MNCIYCEGETKVVDSRPTNKNEIRRRRECLTCGYRFTTMESVKKEKIEKYKIGGNE